MECLKLLYDKMHELRTKFFDSPLREYFRYVVVAGVGVGRVAGVGAWEGEPSAMLCF